MGGTSTQESKQTSQTSPWAAAAPALNSAVSGLNAQLPNAGLTPTETSALDAWKANAQAGNPFAGSISDLAKGLLSGGGARANDVNISANLAGYQGLLSPYANGSMIGNNKALQDQLSAITSDVTNQVNSQFAAAGRDGSAANLQALGRGIAQGTAPVIASQYNQDVANQLNAANSLYGAGNTSYGLLNQNNQQANANAQAGVGVGNAALDASNWGASQLLGEEAQRRGIPLNAYQTLLGSILPLAQAFGTNNSTSNQTSTMSGAQQFGTIASGLGSLAGIFKSIPSDRRLKEDITQVGTLFDGSPVYRYRYRNSPAFQIGLMAQDVETRTPDAVIEIGGFKAVDYQKATEAAVRMENADGLA
ncbi:tail fiber domain-containing protein [Bradyrhizobium prioriisuperbiae]|uniref:tail fiber domain-containing protein n=1 Tax=Bradyrhizobium prioriisuperbiae TaxID=2854389 RepID=UPI0028E4971C|nr:tail fiber domain-containing protein [Bradyrhizobium prioritasuperba]